MNAPATVYIGVDVSKASLDFNAEGVRPGRVDNSPPAIRRELGRIRKCQPAEAALHVCCESTGCYHDKLKTVCQKMGLAFSTLNAFKVKEYAKSTSILAKTDRIDAELIRRYAQHIKPAPDLVLSQFQKELRDLAKTRASFTEMLVQAKTLLETAIMPQSKRHFTKHRSGLERTLKTLDRQMMELRRSDARCDAVCTKLAEIEGVGDVTAIMTVALVPELGTLGRRRSASLAGLAPYAKDSGNFKGPRHIRGGRGNVRRLLFMPAFVAMRHNPILRDIYQKKRAEGKPHKVTLTALMRKLFARMDRVAAIAIQEFEAAHQGT